MIKSITVTNYLNESMSIDLASPEKSGLAISNIDGLGPAKANINKSDLASMDGSVFNSARLSERSISITFILVPNESDKTINTAEKVRQKIYKYFPIKKKARLTFYTESRTAYVDGYVETNDSTIFSKQVTMTVTLLCTDPWFYATSNENTRFSGTEGSFTFPFSASDEPADLSFGTIYTDTSNNVYYSGDSETGIVITIHAIGEATNLKIYNINTHENMTFNDTIITKTVGSTLKAGDDLVISTLKGKKSVKLVREGTTYNLLNAINRNADWFQLSKGDNLFAFTADDDAVSSPLNLIFDIESTVIYEGI